MTIKETQEEIIKEFEGLDNWEKRNNQLIKLGKNLSSIVLELKKEENIIRSSQVKTWYYSVFQDGKVFYYIDSVSIIIRGIIVLLIRTLSSQKPEDIKDADLYFIDRIGLREDFSPIKANSLFKLVGRIKSDAIEYEKKNQ